MNIKNQIKEIVADSLNYYNVDDEDMDELMEDTDDEDLFEIKNALETLNQILFKCNS